MPPRTEGRIARLAERQHGLVTRAQLLGLGLGPDAIKYRVRTKRYVRVDLGVYRIGPPVAPHAREMAAALACGPRAVVSHRSAAWLWQLDGSQATATVDITLPPPVRRRRRGVRVHRSPLEPAERTSVHGIPTTTPARTLLDLAAVLRLSALEQAVSDALRRRLVGRARLGALVAGAHGRPGAGSLRSVLGEAEPSLTRSEAEARLLALVRRSGLPSPVTNARVGGFEVDVLWPRERVVVEVDGFAFHGSRARFEADRRRDANLAARGFRVLRVTWRQITEEPEPLLVSLAGTLAMARAS